MSRIGLRIEADAAFALQDPGRAANPRRFGFDEVRRVVGLADRLGYDSVWLPEGFGRDAVTFLAALGLHTERIRLATGILSTYTRDPDDDGHVSRHHRRADRRAGSSSVSASATSR